jgi:hypothetical protein
VAISMRCHTGQVDSHFASLVKSFCKNGISADVPPQKFHYFDPLDIAFCVLYNLFASVRTLTRRVVACRQNIMQVRRKKKLKLEKF